MGLGLEIQDPAKNLFWILGSKRHRIPDPEHCCSLLELLINKMSQVLDSIDCSNLLRKIEAHAKLRAESANFKQYWSCIATPVGCEVSIVSLCTLAAFSLSFSFVLVQILKLPCTMFLLQSFVLNSLRNKIWNSLTIAIPAERIEWYIEDQALSMSYDLAAFIPLPLSELSQFLILHVRVPGREGKGEGRGGLKSYDNEKSWSSKNYSILSAYRYP
jgi:hypothetical protein